MNEGHEAARAKYDKLCRLPTPAPGQGGEAVAAQAQSASLGSVVVRVCLAGGSREAALQVRCKWLTGKIAEARFRTVVKEPFQQALTSNISCKAWQAKTQDCGLDGFAPR